MSISWTKTLSPILMRRDVATDIITKKLKTTPKHYTVYRYMTILHEQVHFYLVSCTNLMITRTSQAFYNNKKNTISIIHYLFQTQFLLTKQTFSNFHQVYIHVHCNYNKQIVPQRSVDYKTNIITQEKVREQKVLTKTKLHTTTKKQRMKLHTDQHQPLTGCVNAIPT